MQAHKSDICRLIDSLRENVEKRGLKMADRRTRKTRKALQVGLIHLLESKDLHKITVKELVEIVDIHRSTFYLNFDDIYELYDSIEEEALSEIEEIIATVDDYLEPRTFYTQLFAFMKQNRPLCKLFFSDKSSKKFKNGIMSLMQASYLAKLEEKNNIDIKNESVKQYAYFCLVGTQGIIEKWFKGQIACSEDELIQMLVDIDVSWTRLIQKKFTS